MDVKYNIYLDDQRTPIPREDWVVVRNYDEFVSKIEEIGLENINIISLDHDLDESAMREWRTNVYVNSKLDYNNITEKTGLDCVNWLIDQWKQGKPFVVTHVHSANALGAANILGQLWNHSHIHRLPLVSQRWIIPHLIEESK